MVCCNRKKNPIFEIPRTISPLPLLNCPTPASSIPLSLCLSVLF